MIDTSKDVGNPRQHTDYPFIFKRPIFDSAYDESKGEWYITAKIWDPIFHEWKTSTERGYKTEESAVTRLERLVHLTFKRYNHKEELTLIWQGVDYSYYQWKSHRKTEEYSDLRN